MTSATAARRPARTLNMPSDVAIDPRTGDLYIADMHHNRVRKVDARTHIITTVAGSGVWGYSGDDGPATEARLAGPAGVAVVPEPDGKVTIFIADYYNGHVRAVGPDGIIRDLSDEGREASSARRTRGVRLAGPRRGWLYVADSSQDRIVPLIIPRIAPNLVQAPRPGRCRHPTGRADERTQLRSLLRWTLSFLRPYRGRVALAGGAAPVPRSRSARCSPGRCNRHRLRARRPADPLPEPFAGWLPADSRRRPLVLLVALVVAGVVLQLTNQFVSRLQHAGAGRYRPADGLRPALASVSAPAGARPPPSHHDQHGGRGLPRGRRRVRDREPGDERRLSAGDVGRRRWR